MDIELPSLGFAFPQVYLLQKQTESGKHCFGIQRVSRFIFAYFDAIMYMNFSILWNHSNIVVFFVLT